MDRKIILCDADDTIENLLDCWVEYLNSKFGTTVKPTDVTDWNVSLFFPSIPKEEVYAPIYQKDFWNNLSAIDGCYDVLKEINDKHDLFIVTATNYQTCDTKIERILQLFPFLKWSQFIIASKKQLVHGDILIDDGVHNFQGGSYSGLLFDRPHNHNFDNQAAGLTRVYSWHEIGQILL
jgi:5'(3')-deoxyribonucleotidase